MYSFFEKYDLDCVIQNTLGRSIFSVSVVAYP